MNRHLGLFLPHRADLHRRPVALNYFSFALGFSQAELIVGWHASGGEWPSDELAGSLRSPRPVGSACRFSSFLTAHEFGHYFAGPLARPSPLASLLPAGAAAADRLARRGHRLPRPLPEPARPVRLRRRRSARWLRRRGHRAGVRPGLVAGREAAGEVRRLLAGRAAAVPVARMHAIAGPIRDGWSVNLHPTALAGWLGLLFTHDEPGADQPARRRPHRLCRASAVVAAGSRWRGWRSLAFFIVWRARLLLDRSGSSCCS